MGSGAVGQLGPGAVVNSTTFASGNNNGSFTATTVNGGPALTLGSLPFIASAPALSNGAGFRLSFDANEPGGSTARLIDISSISISIGSSTVWSFADTITLNPPSVGANASDLNIFIPLALFQNKGFSTSSAVTFRWTIANASAGNDFWNFSADGTRILTNADLITAPPPPAVPLPPAAALILTGMGALGWLRTRRGAKKA